MEELDVKMEPDDGPRGYILKCGLGNYYFYFKVYFIECNVSFLCISEYPRDFIRCNVALLSISEHPHKLHDLHKDYLLAPERLQIEENILSIYQHHLLQDEGFSKSPPKLIPNLCNKTNYIIHCTRIASHHRVLSFDQLPWLKNYINFNTRQSSAVKNDFEKDFFKLINNAVFGKSFMCLFVLL